MLIVEINLTVPFPTNDKLPIQYTKQKLHQIFETFVEEYIPETTIWKL